MAIRTVIPTRIAERTTPRISAVLKDETGAVIPGSALTALTLTLYLAGDLTQILNGRNKQNVLNANGVTVDAAGNLIWTSSAADHAFLSTAEEEAHVALFEWTWAAGAKAGKHELLLYVTNLVGVP